MRSKQRRPNLRNSRRREKIERSRLLQGSLCLAHRPRFVLSSFLDCESIIIDNPVLNRYCSQHLGAEVPTQGTTLMPLSVEYTRTVDPALPCPDRQLEAERPAQLRSSVLASSAATMSPAQEPTKLRWVWWIKACRLCPLRLYPPYSNMMASP